MSRRSGVADVVLDKMAHDYDDLDLAAMAHERRAEYLRRKRAVRTIESAYKEHANGHPQSVDERADWGTIRFVWTDHDADETDVPAVAAGSARYVRLNEAAKAGRVAQLIGRHWRLGRPHPHPRARPHNRTVPR